MSFSTLTRYLRLKVATDLSQQASQNLARLDALGNTFGVGETDDLTVRSRGNIVLQPEATLVGGTGSGGEVHLGSSSQPADIKMFASSFALNGNLSLANAAGKKVSLAVDSSQAINKTLTLLATANASLSIEYSGSVVTDESTHTLINKSISGDANLLSNIAYSSLNLSGSIKNSDIAASAAIADTKLATISTAGKVNVSALTGSLSGSLLPSYSGNGEKYLRLNQAGNGLEWSTLVIPEGYTDSDADLRVVAGIAAARGTADGIASLDSNGKLPTSQLPSLAITAVNVVSSQAAMLALSADQGDVAVRTDNGKTYLLAGDPTVLSDWKEIVAAGAVTSVNGQTGTVSLSSSNVNEGTNLYYTAARVQSEIDSHVAKTTWSGGNSVTLTTGWGTKDVLLSVFDSSTNEIIIPYSVTWATDNNSVTLALPSGSEAGTWRVLAYKM